MLRFGLQHRRGNDHDRPRPVPIGDDQLGPEPSELARNLAVLGLGPDASWSEIAEAHRRLVSDLTPGPDATHRNVARAQALLQEVNAAYDSLRLQVSA